MRSDSSKRKNSFIMDRGDEVFLLEGRANPNLEGNVETYRVRVLENNSCPNHISYKLEVLEVLHESSVSEPNEVGDIFTVKKEELMLTRKNYGI